MIEAACRFLVLIIAERRSAIIDWETQADPSREDDNHRFCTAYTGIRCPVIGSKGYLPVLT